MFRFCFMSRFRNRVRFRVKILFRITDGSELGLQSRLGSELRSRLGSVLRLSSDIGNVQS